MRGILRLYSDDLAGAIADLGVAAARMHTGLPSTYPVPCLAALSDAYFRRGDWDAAIGHAQLATSLAQDTDRPIDLARAHGRAAQVLACRGQWAAAQVQVAAARAAAQRLPLVFAIGSAAAAGVALASARGDLAGVLIATEAVRATNLLDVGGRPGIFNWRAAEVDALIGLGQLDEAESALQEFESAIPEQWSAIRRTVHRALPRQPRRGTRRRHSMRNRPSTARTRRSRRVDAVRTRPAQHLTTAATCARPAGNRQPSPSSNGPIALFSDLGADPYVQACAEELAALRVTAATASPATILGLSRAELAVARLVATGLTNREVASQLYLSVKTVEYHLRNSYMKLDITSRRELSALVQ